MKSSLRLVAATVTAAALLMACGSGETPDANGDEPDPTSTETPGATPGGEITIAFGSDANGLDKSAVIGEESIWIQQQLYATLYAPTPDGRSLQPELADEHTLSDDGLEWTFTLREGLLFSDGTPLTAEDVKFSLEESRDQGGLLSFLYRAFAEIEAPNDRTLVIRTEEPFAPMLAILSERSAGVVPADYGGRDRDEFYENPVSSGPFAFESWSRGEEMVLVRNDNYFDPPLLDKVIFKVVTDDNARVLQLRDGQFDMMGSVPFSSLSTITESEDLELRDFPWTNVEMIILNQSVEAFSDPHVRLAMSLAIDREAIANQIFSGLAQPAHSFIAGSLVDEQPAEYSTFDLEAARDRLAQSAFPDGFSFTLNYPGTSQTVGSEMQAVKQQLAQIGIEMVLRPLEGGGAEEAWFSGEYEAVYASLSSDIPDADFMATAFTATAGLFSGYQSEEAAILGAQAASSMDEDERQRLYSEMLDVIMQDMPLLPIIEQSNLYAHQAGVTGFDVAIQGQLFLVDVSAR